MLPILLLAVVVLFNGCASIKAIERNYQHMVDVKDGVDIQEAKIIAQHEIILTYEKRDYRVTAPDINTTDYAKQYPDFWFVTFGHNWFSPMSTDPLAKTYTELREGVYVVVIDKKTGAIQFSGEWYPKRDESFNWVFNPDGYRASNSMALAPFSKGHRIEGL